jgi:hypothetical protein
VRIQFEGKAPFGISNEWFRGPGVRQGETCYFSTRIRTLVLFHGRANFLSRGERIFWRRIVVCL